MNIINEINNRILICDGALGTMLQNYNLPDGICPESLNEDRPEIIEEIATLYLNSGANIITTNTFGGNSFKLDKFDKKDCVAKYNSLGVKIARKIIGSNGFVFASCGTTGEILKAEGGLADEKDIYNAYKEQISSMVDADCILIETQYSSIEASLAIKAAKEVTNLPVICTFSFELGKRGYRTIMGLTTKKAISKVIEAGCDIVGANCGNGIDNMVEICKEIRNITDKPILINSNAGLPVFENGKTIFKETPEYMASKVLDLINAGANIIGGCCGTNEKHIKAMAEVINNYNKN